MKGRKIALVLFLTLMITTTCLLLIPRPPQIGKNISYIDKIEHTAVFIGLSFLLAYSISGRRTGRAGRLFLAVALTGSYGILMEIMQRYTGRNFEAADIAADLTGALIGGVLSIFFCD